jgi:hypothetical protein
VSILTTNEQLKYDLAPKKLSKKDFIDANLYKTDDEETLAGDLQKLIRRKIG